MILIGGNILGRGITLQGLVTSYYMRPAKYVAMDTTLQHCRWMGWHPMDADLVQLFIGQDHLDNFKVIANADKKVRQDIANISADMDFKECLINSERPYFGKSKVTKRRQAHQLS